MDEAQLFPDLEADLAAAFEQFVGRPFTETLKQAVVASVDRRVQFFMGMPAPMTSIGGMRAFLRHRRPHDVLVVSESAPGMLTIAAAGLTAAEREELENNRPIGVRFRFFDGYEELSREMHARIDRLAAKIAA